MLQGVQDQVHENAFELVGVEFGDDRPGREIERELNRLPVELLAEQVEYLVDDAGDVLRFRPDFERAERESSSDWTFRSRARPTSSWIT